ncbi:MAG: hypothetical protein AMJ56_00265 [Anaerolineae bacterium SG8_19]|nr:MAG: hypothetical protein AMJ56_00265 [Anaerolineae bacterium SG8_19]
MPHSSFKILPGVDQNKTPALNEAAISESQLIRFIPDRTLGGLVQKLGGWTKFYANTIGSIVRCLWAWEDTNANSYLAVGAEGLPANGGGALEVIVSGGATDITPQTTVVNIPVSFSTTLGSNEVIVTDTGRNADNYDVVDLKTQVSVGGLVLFGQYQVYNPGASANTYKIYATNVLGEPAYATSTVANGGAVPDFSTTSGSDFVDVTLANHGLAIGDTFPILIATSVGGVTLYGNYIVTDVISSSVFTISASTQASSTTTGFENSGNAYFIYYNGIGPLPGGTGYGVGPYGGGGYGTGIPPVAGTGTPINAIDWTLDNWGQILISCPLNGPIYQWDPTSGNPTALIIPEAPSVNDGIFVAMPQRQIIAWGSTFNGIKDPLLIRWCDVNNFTAWIAQITNQAGSYRIPKGSRIVQCIQAGQQGLIWTDLGIWAMQYAGPPYVYQFNELGTGCGLIGRKAATSVGGLVYWMGQSQFYRLSGGGVEPIRCPVWDVVFQDLDTNNLEKIRVAPNSRFGEIAWYYPTKNNGGEISHYIKYNYILDQWDFGQLARTAWINESVLGPPIGAAPNTYIYQHETSTDADGEPMNSSFQTGYFVLNEADNKMFVDQVWPDMKWGYYGGTQSANVNLTFYVADYAGQTPTSYGPFTLTQATTYITPRFRGRLVSIKMNSNDIGSFWRIGNTRYRFQPDGKY